MTYFLEYLTLHSVGRASIHSLTFHDALSKAKQSLQGLECLRAVLRYTQGEGPAFGEGVVTAAFTASGGWTTPGPWDGDLRRP
ncbi:hypothetical protein [Pseudarthrobacter niigatensis]|uniref:Uncharacterized protein n=1 Tax=Pseudarthrobacter niigatensis TaxID=369935 RepID=A0AAJ1WC73_9MICC|nr:hypothetical protein [Pseudarthrobacter niigatensis]MDQ0144734.1 hypothetical protein [Pseudarthrobacter niigatensis]MDQ0265381.1 hypothetical protein [Pseudarthrobacter niigatensis]